jgi:hypothetical protein
MKKIREDKPIGVIIHTYMEISQGNSLCSYLYLKQAKISCLSFYLLFFYKIREQEGRTSLAQGKGLALVGVGRCWGKGLRRVNVVLKNVYACK